jgi:DNA topoisomerase-1
VTRDRAKFDRMLEFAEQLPAARRRVARHLRDPEPTRRRALACAFRILDLGCMRIGSEQYARDDGGVGLATLRTSEATLDGHVVHLAFHGKAGIRHEIDLRDARLAAALAPLVARGPGTELLAYQVDGDWRDVRSADITSYIHEVVGDRFSAKDFRTWRATVTAFEALMGQDPPRSKREEARARTAAAEAAAEQLGNTPTIAKNAYIDPRVFDRFTQGKLVDVDGPPEAGVLELLG